MDNLSQVEYHLSNANDRLEEYDRWDDTPGDQRDFRMRIAHNRATHELLRAILHLKDEVKSLKEQLDHEVVMSTEEAKHLEEKIKEVRDSQAVPHPTPYGPGSAAANMPGALPSPGSYGR